MLQYQVTVRIDQSAVKALRANQTNLCCAFGFKADESKAQYNVISWAEDPTPVNTISWSDDYHIAGCKKGIEDGSNATPNTTAVPIKPGEIFSLNPDWTSIKTNVTAEQTDTDPDRKLAAKSFIFANGMPATAMVFSRIRSQHVGPVYLLSMGPYPMLKGTYRIRPTGNLILFFMSKREGAEFEFADVSNMCELRYEEQKNVSISFTADRNWVVENPVDGDGRDHEEDWTRSAKL